VLDEYLRLIEPLGCYFPSRKMELAVLPDDQQKLDKFWAQNLNRQHGDWSALTDRNTPDFVCLNTGGAFGPAKNWPREYFAELAHRVATELHYHVLVVCGPKERDDARWIATEAKHPSVVSFADIQPSIGLTKAAIRAARLLVTTDSGPRHFAAPFGTPVVTLFGPTHMSWSENFYDRAEHLQLKVDCGPCQQRECPLGHHKCLRDLTVDKVFAAVKRWLPDGLHRRKAG
jgi:heptosyltransferase-2